MNSILHKDIQPKLYRLANNDISNIIFFGPEGSGKKTIVNFLINTYFNCDVKTKDTPFKLKLKTNTIELNIQSSAYHFEIIITKYTNGKHTNLLLLHLTNNNEINNSFKLIVIYNAEYLNNDNKKLIKNLIEKKDVKFILVSTNISKIDNYLQSFFLIFRIPKCSKEELYEFFKTKTTIDSKTLKSYIDVSKKNIGEIEQLIKNNSIKKYTHPYVEYTKEIEKLLLKFSLKNIKKLREVLYTHCSKNICLNRIFEMLIKNLLKNNKLQNKKQRIIEIYILFFNRIPHSFKPIIQYEALIMNIYNIIHL